jgi:glycosyltransferase involved in cell wall biosynthesis
MTLLTIAIPTYERPRQLAQICEQLRDVTADLDNIRILISDNSQTPESRQSNQQNASPFEYFSNSENLGFSGNLISIINRCNSKYLWFLSDDDLLHREETRLMLRQLLDQSLGDFDCLMLPFTYADESGLVNTAADYGFPRDIEQLFGNAVYFPFILFSSFIINLHARSAEISTTKMAAVLDDHNGNDLIQIIFAISCLPKTARVDFYPQPIIHYLPGEIGRFLPSDLLRSELEVLALLHRNNQLSRQACLVRSKTCTVNQLRYVLRIKAGVQKNLYLDSHPDFRPFPAPALFLKHSSPFAIALWLLTCLPHGAIKILYRVKDHVKSRH